jgi:signal transduction histidine kinase
MTRLRRLLLAAGPAFIVLLLGALTLDGVRRTRESRSLVDRTHAVIERAHVTLSALQDAETGQRGYLLTGDSSYLAPYQRAVVALPSDTSGLRAVIIGDPAQQARLDSAGRLIGIKMQELGATVALRNSRGLDESAKLVSTNHGKMAMDTIRSLLNHIVSTEQTALERREAAESEHGQIVTITLVAGTLAAVLLALLGNTALLRYAAGQESLARELDAGNAQLNEQAVELELQSQQLQEQAAELEAQAEDLEAANRDLSAEMDISEAARTAAEAANRAKSEFLAVMSHELRTPLNAIAGYAQLMQLGVPEPVPEVHQDYIARIQMSQRHLLGLINAVLNFARTEAGAVTYDLRNVPVGALLGTIEPLIAPQMLARGHHYECVPCERSLVVRADGDKVAQILLNLLSNAIKFTPSGGAITLSAEAVRGVAGEPMVAMRVHDTGPGIPPEKLSAIFDPFVQIDASLSRSTDGAGLGLAISRNLAQGMSGDLTVESEVGAGSTFSLLLPLASG